jgi:hypothetical protein
MEKFKTGIDDHANAPVVHYSNGVNSSKTRSSTHGGFDNDPVTMNHILRDILGRAPAQPFTSDSLKY